MARTLYLVCYDVANPARLRRIGRYVRGFRVSGQKSCHECWLTPEELRELRRFLASELCEAEDRVHVFQLDPRMAVVCAGRGRSFTPGPFLIL